jgi:hypothetical protein
MRFLLKKDEDPFYYWTVDRSYSTASQPRQVKVKLTRFVWSSKEGPQSLEGRRVLHCYDIIRALYVRKHRLKIDTASGWVRNLPLKSFPRFLFMETADKEIYLDYKGSILLAWELVGEEAAQLFVTRAPDLFRVHEADVSEFLIALHNENRTPANTIEADPYDIGGEGGKCTDDTNCSQKRARTATLPASSDATAAASP